MQERDPFRLADLSAHRSWIKQGGASMAAHSPWYHVPVAPIQGSPGLRTSLDAASPKFRSGSLCSLRHIELEINNSTIAVDRDPELEYSVYGLWPGIESAEALDHYSPPEIRHVRLSANLAQGEVQLTGHLVPFRAPLRVAPHRQSPITGIVLLSASAHDEATGNLAKRL